MPGFNVFVDAYGVSNNRMIRYNVGDSSGNCSEYGFSALTGNQVLSDYSFLGGGQTNLTDGDWSFVGGGYGNCNIGCYSLIAGGCNNSITTVPVSASGYGPGCNNVIAGGYNNLIGYYTCMSAQCPNIYSFIGGGCGNTVCSNYSFIGGGDSNCVSGSGSAVITGNLNQVFTCCSFIGAGYGNVICDNGAFNSIVGGNMNYICSNAKYGFIGGGAYNCLGSGSNNFHSSILGGCGNCIHDNADCSTILGGCGNVIPAGCTYVGIFGCNIGTIAGCVQSGTFHVNKLYADSIPHCTAITGCPAGTIYYDNPGGIFPAGCKALFVL